MEENETPKLEERIKELEEGLKNLEFLSDQTRFNSVVYQGLSLILKRLDEIEGKIK